MTAGRNTISTYKDWGTPKKYVNAVKTFFGKIFLDPCSNEFSIVNAETEYSLPKNDGLKESWKFPTIYVNPPYGKDKERRTSIKDWLRRCLEANKDGSEVLALIPVAPNTSHWKEFIWNKAKAICFLYDTRLPFLVKGKKGGKGAPMACCMVYWGNKYDKFRGVFNEFGAIIKIQSSLRSANLECSVSKGEW